jgi:hypothetical protein
MAGARDTNPGTFFHPLKTIQAGTNLAQAGDTILVKKVFTAKMLNPPRSGTKDKPIIYLASSGEDVSIRGSERIADWINGGTDFGWQPLTTQCLKHLILITPMSPAPGYTTQELQIL